VFCTGFAQNHESGAKNNRCLYVKVTPLRYENEWYNWKPQFTNLLKGIPGITQVPLSYIIRANPTPLPIAETADMTYVDQLEATVPHTGDSYVADNAQLQLLLRSYIDPKNDGANSML
jgi:hypothetical protein